MFDSQEFIDSCQTALKEHAPELAIKELVERAMSRPSEVVSAFGTPTQGGITTLHRSNELTVLHIIWPPGVVLYPHNHNLWAVIGLYGGQEDNTFFRLNPKDTTLVRAGSKALRAQDTIVLGKDAIHAVANPLGVYTGAVHVYGGDFFAEPRSEWDNEQSPEQPYSVDRLMQTFAVANERWRSEQDQPV